MSDDSTHGRAGRLELAGHIAPALRRVKHETAQRRVKLVDKDGAVTGEATLGDALKGLAKIHELEHAVADGQRAKFVTCHCCGLPVPQEKKAGMPRRACKEGEGCAKQTECAGDNCGKSTPRHAFAKKNVVARDGAPWRCSPCARLAMTPEKKAVKADRVRQAVLAANAARTPEERSEIARRRAAAMTPEERSEMARRANAALTPEERSAAKRKAAATRLNRPQR